MKKLIAVLIVFLLILTFISCVDNKQTDKEGDVTLPQTAEASGSASITETKGESTPFSTSADVELNKHYFN